MQNPDEDRPYIAPGKSLREQIMARRAAARGEPVSYALTADEWDREWAQKPRWEPPVREDAPQLVYFIRSDAGPIKIGIAGDVARRHRTLQLSSPVTLTVAVTCAGGLEQERAYHRQFAEHRLHGEWFNPHPDILAEIERLGQ